MEWLHHQQSRGRYDESSEHTQHHSRPSSFHLWPHPSPVRQHSSTQGAVARRQCQIWRQSISRLESIAQLPDHGPHGLARLCGTPDSLLLTHGPLPRPVNMEGATTHSRLRAAVSEWVSDIIHNKKLYIACCNVAYYAIQLIRRTRHLHIQFTNITHGLTALDVIPWVRMCIPETHAELLGTSAVGLSWMPVGVVHRRHCITVRVSWCHSPDERRTTSRIYALSSCPKGVCHIFVFVASSCFQCSSLNSQHFNR